MTEYDYSPDAVERFYEKQNSVARWVDNQAYQAPGYGNPFVPDAASRSGGGGSSANNRSGNLGRSVSSPVDPRHAYPRPATAHGHRSGQRGVYPSTNASTPTLVPNGQAPLRYSSGSSSQTQSRSHSQTPAHRRPPPSRSQTYVHARGASTGHAVPPLPARSTTLPSHLQSQQPGVPQYTSAPGQTVVMQNGRQTYVVVPPHNARVQICVRISFRLLPSFPCASILAPCPVLVLTLFFCTSVPFHFALPGPNPKFVAAPRLVRIYV